MKTENISKKTIIKMMIISFIIVLLFWEKNNLINHEIYRTIQSILYNLFTPFKLYTTAIHEGWHALITLITGGEIVEISLENNGSGHVVSRGGLLILITSAGYIGSAITGGLLIISAKSETVSKISLFLISLIIIILNIIYIDSYASVAFLSSIAMSLILLNIIFKTSLSNNIAIFLGTILAVDSFGDIRKIIFQIPYKTDAGILARNLGMEFMTIPIAIIFSVICMYIWWLSIKYIMKNT